MVKNPSANTGDIEARVLASMSRENALEEGITFLQRIYLKYKMKYHRLQRKPTQCYFNGDI